MRLPGFLLRRLHSVVANARWEPYEHLAGYMNRWWLIKPSWKTLGFGVRVHQILRSDHDRDLHGHPWASLSIILDGGYVEEVPQRQVPLWMENGDLACRGATNTVREAVYEYIREPGDVIYRSRAMRHRLRLASVYGEPALTLFITGPRNPENRWGFTTPDGWVWWQDYFSTNERKKGE
jgi:hypothetical protein